MFVKIKSFCFTACKVGFSAVKAFFAINTFFDKFIPQVPILKKFFAPISAVVTGLFYLTSRGPAIHKSYQEEIKPKHSYFQITSGLAITSNAFASFSTLYNLLPGSWYIKLLALIPSLINLKSFDSYNLNIAYHNFQKLSDLYCRKEIDENKLLLILLLMILPSLGLTLFNTFLQKEFLDQLPEFEYDESLYLIILILLNSATCIITALCRSGSIALGIINKDEIDVTEQLSKHSCEIKALSLCALAPLSGYETLSTTVGYFIAAVAIFESLKFTPRANYTLSASIALLSSFAEIYFTQRPAINNFFTFLANCDKGFVESDNEEQKRLINEI